MKAGGYRQAKRKVNGEWVPQPGVFEFRVRIEDPLTGESVRRSHTWHGTKWDVGGALAKWVADELRKVRADDSDRTLSWLVGKYLELQSASLSTDTIRTYRGYAKTWIDPDAEHPNRIGKLPIDKLTSGHLRELHAAMAAEGRKPSTIRQVHNIIRGSLTYAVDKEWLGRNVAALKSAPKLPGADVVACTEAELWDLLTEAGERGNDLWTAIALGAALGWRLGQLCAIRHSDIDLDGRTVMRRATRKSKAKAIPIDNETADVLKTRLEWQQRRWEQVYGGPRPRDLKVDPWLLSFVSDGTEPNPDSYTAAFSRLRKQLGYMHLHFHCLRHYCATTLINAGVPLPVVAERLGHSSPAVTARIYAHVVSGRHEEAAEVAGRSLPLGERPKTRQSSAQLELATPAGLTSTSETTGGTSNAAS